MRAIDTNLLVRLLVRDDAAQVRAAEAFVAKGAWVSHLVLAETIWVLEAVYDRGREQLVVAVEMLLQHAHLTIHDADVVEAALAHFSARGQVDFSDCLLLEQARRAGHLPLGTFDRSLARLPGAEHLVAS